MLEGKSTKWEGGDTHTQMQMSRGVCKLRRKKRTRKKKKVGFRGSGLTPLWRRHQGKGCDCLLSPVSHSSEERAGLSIFILIWELSLTTPLWQGYQGKELWLSSVSNLSQFWGKSWTFYVHFNMRTVSNNTCVTKDQRERALTVFRVRPLQSLTILGSWTSCIYFDRRTVSSTSCVPVDIEAALFSLVCVFVCPSVCYSITSTFCSWCLNVLLGGIVFSLACICVCPSSHYSHGVSMFCLLG